MKVLVTGGCGFLGSHVCEAFRKEGADVVAFDNMTKHELKRTGYGSDEVRDHNAKVLREMGVQVVKADIRNREELLDHAQGCSFLAHTAAQPAMTISWEDIDLDFSTNVAGTFNVLETARRHKAAVASCSSVHVYGPWVNDTLTEGATRYERKPVAIREDDPTMNGGKDGKISPLHASKAAGEHYVKTYADMFGVKAANFRYTGIYGPRQFGGEDHGWVANFAIRNLLGWPLTIYGTGKQLRDILYASDAAAAFVQYQRKPVAGTYNIGGGPGHMISLLECIQLIDKLSGTKSEVKFGPGRDGDLRYFVCDITRARNGFGWEPKVPPHEGVGKLLAWLRENARLFQGQPAVQAGTRSR
ncbi:MAG: NAD-dependent epimerase/dehydratase family protein [Planctomycetota bacterium]|nr:MAG: NAD-dependent epimerase/dehydratase family protein [Planctomycetota bacterium]